ncbi:hypothetical protein WBJ53_26050 [Spirosoma sp. SC4-14]|uniref:hypothetical protein n=1 Tax=Spirosoma sp. SC4-14 TaxID=3128900 RepID=UPI0030CB403B
MPDRLYTAADQTAIVVGAPNTGVDIVPGNVIKCVFVALADFAMTEITLLTLSAWQTFLADQTKTHAVTPFIDAFDLPPTTPITEAGNDNTTWNGVPRQRSTSFAVAKGKFSGADATQIKALRKLGSKSGNFQQGTRIGVIFIHEGTSITCLANAKPIPAYNIFISDPKKGGLGASNDYDFEFHLQGNWSTNEKMYELAFEGATLTN